jgi:hypothetical protein
MDKMKTADSRAHASECICVDCEHDRMINSEVAEAGGKGKYDDVCEEARKKCGEGASVLLIVVNGELGHGFSVQANLNVHLMIPTILRSIADDIDVQIIRNRRKG